MAREPVARAFREVVVEIGLIDVAHLCGGQRLTLAMAMHDESQVLPAAEASLVHRVHARMLEPAVPEHEFGRYEVPFGAAFLAMRDCLKALCQGFRDDLVGIQVEYPCGPSVKLVDAEVALLCEIVEGAVHNAGTQALAQALGAVGTAGVYH